MSKIIEAKRCDLVRFKRDYAAAEAWSREVRCKNCCSTYRIGYSDIEYEHFYDGGGDYVTHCPVCKTRKWLWFLPRAVKRCYDITRQDYEQMLSEETLRSRS